MSFSKLKELTIFNRQSFCTNPLSSIAPTRSCVQTASWWRHRSVSSVNKRRENSPCLRRRSYSRAMFSSETLVGVRRARPEGAHKYARYRALDTALLATHGRIKAFRALRNVQRLLRGREAGEESLRDCCRSQIRRALPKTPHSCRRSSGPHVDVWSLKSIKAQTQQTAV